MYSDKATRMAMLTMPALEVWTRELRASNGNGAGGARRSLRGGAGVDVGEALIVEQDLVAGRDHRAREHRGVGGALVEVVHDAAIVGAVGAVGRVDVRGDRRDAVVDEADRVAELVDERRLLDESREVGEHRARRRADHVLEHR